MTSLDDAATTLRVVIPGFLALRVIYWRALRTQRTDLELILWSLVASVPLYGAALWLRPEDDLGTLGIAVAFAVAVGLIVAEAWRALVRRRPEYRAYMLATGWDAVIGRPEGGWFQVRTSDGTTYHGWAQVVADSAQTDSLDLYLWEPSYVDLNGDRIRLAGAEGVLLLRSSIVSVVRFSSDAEPAEAPG